VSQSDHAPNDHDPSGHDPSGYDIEFFWDPVCPFAWMTSRWVHQVAAQRDYSVDWRFISLRLLNKDKDYGTEFPEGYPKMHGAGLRMLRVAAKVRAEVGRDPLGGLYTAYGRSIWDRERVDGGRPREDMGSDGHIREVLEIVGLPVDLAAAADDEGWDAEIDAETELALSRTGREVGTPIITFDPPEGVSFFGPVISRLPDDADALELWDAVTTLAAFPSFAELKKSLREMPQLRAFGAEDPVLADG
jgi:2-hydroxychromene-2-carboxylate isomerase